MTELREKINDIILSYCEGHYHLEFTEDDLPNILNEIEEAINYNRCCTTLKVKDLMTFEDYKNNLFIKKDGVYQPKKTKLFRWYSEKQLKKMYKDKPL